MSIDQLSRPNIEAGAPFARPTRLSKLVSYVTRIVEAPELDSATRNIDSAKRLLEEAADRDSYNRMSDLNDMFASQNRLLSVVRNADPVSKETAITLIDDTAESLFEAIDLIKHGPSSGGERKVGTGIDSVLTCIKAWDSLRSQPTADLAIKLIEEFPGVAKDTLKNAFKLSRDNDIPFDDALDTVNSVQRIE